MFPKLPLATAGLKKRLLAIMALVSASLIYLSIQDLIPSVRNFMRMHAYEHSVLSLGFLVILLICLSGLVASERLASLAVKDGLTGLFNQTYIQARLQEELSRSERYHHPLSLIMIDLDDFKAFNDKHGHVSGDRALKAISDILQEIIRSSDVLGRYGGEEFLIILPQTSCLDAAAAAERIRKRIAEHPFKIVARADDISRFTVSLGVYSSSEGTPTIDEVINLADAALYRAKRQGKNKVVVFIK
jgi:diguanylate cyclase (GGDEF)-like protein